MDTSPSSFVCTPWNKKARTSTKRTYDAYEGFFHRHVQAGRITANQQESLHSKDLLRLKTVLRFVLVLRVGCSPSHTHPDSRSGIHQAKPLPYVIRTCPRQACVQVSRSAASVGWLARTMRILPTWKITTSWPEWNGDAWDAGTRSETFVETEKRRLSTLLGFIKKVPHILMVFIKGLD